MLLELLRCYASGQHSLQSLADHLNALGYHTSTGRPLTRTSVEAVLSNRFYEGKAIYHPGQPDEQVRDGIHEVPPEVKDFWLRCQEVRARNQQEGLVGRPREQQRAYPFARISQCARCGSRYGAEAAPTARGFEIRRLAHDRHVCGLRPRTVRIERLMAQFQEGVLPYLRLDEGWKDAVVRAMVGSQQVAPDDRQRARLRRALENLRKQHLWGDLTDDQYRSERQVLERQLQVLERPAQPVLLPNLERAAALLGDLTRLWTHPGVSDRQREALLQDLLVKATIAGDALIGIEPRDCYKPLFAHAVQQTVGNRTPEPLPVKKGFPGSWVGRS